MSKLSNLVKNDLFKKTEYDKLVTKVNNINNSKFVLKTKYDMDKSENKIPDTGNLVKKTEYKPKTTEIEGKIPDVTNLATKASLVTVENKIPDVSGLAAKTALITVENKIPDISNFATKTALTNLSNTVPDINTLIKKSDYDTKIAEIESKYVSNTGFDSKLAQANVITRRNFDVKVIELENNIKKLQTFDSGYFRGKSYFEEGGTQNYLVFPQMTRYFRIIANTKCISSWKSKGLSEDTITPYDTSDNSLTSLIDHYGSKVKLKFNEDCLTQSNKLRYDYGHKVIAYIVYELGATGSSISDLILKNFLFGAVNLTKNADVEKYGYSGFGVGFDRRSSFTFPGGGFGQNVLIFGVDINSSAHIDSKKKYILVLGKGPTQGLEHTLTATKMYSINFTLKRTFA